MVNVILSILSPIYKSFIEDIDVLIIFDIVNSFPDYVIYGKLSNIPEKNMY